MARKPLHRDKWLVEAARDRLFILMRQHVESGHTGELLEQCLMSVASLNLKKGVYARAVEICGFIIARYASRCAAPW